MRRVLLFFLLLVTSGWSTEKKLENESMHPLTGFQKFEVMTLFLSLEKIDTNAVLAAIAESCKRFGQTSISENESMFQNLMEVGVLSPVCFFSIKNDQDQIEVACDVLAEVEVVSNQHKTMCPIWKKTLFSSISEDNIQTELVISNLIQEVIKNFAEDWAKANTLDQKQLSFHVRKFKGL